MKQVKTTESTKSSDTSQYGGNVKQLLAKQQPNTADHRQLNYCGDSTTKEFLQKQPNTKAS